MFKLHKQQISGSIHSGHFMVSRLDDDDDDDDDHNNNEPADDSSERGDNATNVEIDVNDPDSVVEASKGLDLGFRAENPPAKNEQLTSWNDLDRPPGKHSQKQHQYLTYYTTSFGASSGAGHNVNGRALSSERVGSSVSGGGAAGESNTSTGPTQTGVSLTSSNSNNKFLSHHQPPQSDALNLHYSANLQHLGSTNHSAMNHHHHHLMSALSSGGHEAAAAAALNGLAEAGKELLPARLANLEHLHQHHHLQDHQMAQQHQLSIMQAHQLHHHHHQLHQHHHHQLHQHQHQHHQQQHQLHLHQNHQAHHQHAVTIDTSLTKLLECMSLYYSSKLTSPKWKSFKGLKLRLKYKIRLNNLIWRAWFLQCIRGLRQPGCQFTAPAETEVHKKSETIVLEGKYWKRKEKAIVDEYNKWRTFHKQKSCHMTCFRPSSFDWDSRASHLAATSSIFGQDYRFYPDYDMNISYNLEDLPVVLEDGALRDPDEYYAPSNLLETPPPQQQQQPQHHQQQPQQQPNHHQHLMQQHQHQQQQLHHQPQPQHLHQNHHQHQSSNITQHQLHIQPQQQQQLAQFQLSSSNDLQTSQIPLKRELATVPVSSSGNASSHHQQNQPLAITNHQRQPSAFIFDSNSHYQQPQASSLHHQPAASLQHLISSQPQQQVPQNQLLHQQSTPMSLDQDMYHQGSSCDASELGRNEQRRVCHINAEQKRRCNIKNGFDTLKSILPSINQNINVKISKASMLQKAAMYISSLSAEQKQLLEERDMLKQQIEHLKQSITSYQCQLPASGAPVGRNQGNSRAKDTLQEYIRIRTLSNWKFWIFSLLIEPLFDSYYGSVNINSLEESCRTIFNWLDKSCGLMSLRKDIMNSLTVLSTRTDVLNTPQTLPTEAVDAVSYQSELTSAGAGAQSSQQIATANNSNRLIQPNPTSSAQNFFIS